MIEYLRDRRRQLGWISSRASHLLKSELRDKGMEELE
jgi:hypothetical protein